MKILLITSHTKLKPNLLNKILITSFYPSITLEQLISITPDKYELECVDERYQKVDFDWDGDIVGISTLTPSAIHAYKTADEFRKRGKTVVLGGYHPSALPSEAKEHADSVVLGEAELSWPKLLEDFENQKLKPFYKSVPVDPNLIPSPKKINNQLQFYGMVQATRGCVYRCKYCAVQNVEGPIFRTRPIPKVINEIKSLNSKRFMFADSSMTIDTKYTKKLFKQMIGLNKEFSCYGNINVLNKDEELLELAYKAGCESWLIGFESVSQKTISYIGKKTNKVDEYISAVRKIRNYSMMVTGLFMFGFDTDTKDIFDTTLDTIYKMDLDRAAFAILTPYPGTVLFDEMENDKRILTRDWSKYNMKHVVFQPKNLTTDELLEGRKYLSRQYYSLSNCLKRSFSDENLDIIRFLTRTFGDYVLNRYYKLSD